MSDTLMTNEQTMVFWEGIEEGSNFTSFEVAGINLENVNTQALAKVARQATKVGLCNTSITPEQVVAVMSAFEENKGLVEVHNSLSAVDSRLLDTSNWPIFKWPEDPLNLVEIKNPFGSFLYNPQADAWWVPPFFLMKILNFRTP